MHQNLVSPPMVVAITYNPGEIYKIESEILPNLLKIMSLTHPIECGWPATNIAYEATSTNPGTFYPGEWSVCEDTGNRKFSARNFTKNRKYCQRTTRDENEKGPGCKVFLFRV